MSDEDSFLARWSRLKRATAEAVEARDGSPAPAEAAESEADAGLGPSAFAEAGEPASAATAGEPVDLAALPPIETIGPDTDVTAFLREGVPRTLREAALARVWSSDPVISRFVEMADYAWDWNTPGGAPGYGPLDPDVDVAGLVEGIVKGTKALLAERDDASAVALQQADAAAEAGREVDEPQISAEPEPGAIVVSEARALCDATIPRSAAAPDPREISFVDGRPSVDTTRSTGFSPRRHGRALPA